MHNPYLLTTPSISQFCPIFLLVNKSYTIIKSLLFQLGSFHYLSSLLAAASTSEIMLSKSGDRGHP